MKKPRIIEYADHVTSPCSYYRSRGVLNELQKQGEIEFDYGFYNHDEWENLSSFDIAFFQRPMSHRCLDQVAKCADLGLKIVIDLDDKNDAIAPSHPVYDIWCQEYHEKSFQKIMMLADQVWVSTELLKQHYLTYNTNVKVIPNAVNDYWLDIKRFSKNKLVVIRGGNHHLHDIWNFRKEIIEVMQNHKDWKLIVVGGEVKFFDGKIDNYEWKKNLDVHQYFGFLMTMKPGIIISPLEDNDLNRCKSNIGWQEATISGGVSLTPHYYNLRNKSAHYTTKESFKNQFEKLITDDSHRRKLYDKSVQEIKDKYLLSNINKMRLELFKNLVK